MKEFNILISFKSVETKAKTETRLKKDQIIKNVDELHKKYHSTYKSDYDTDDELNEAKKRNCDHN